MFLSIIIPVYNAEKYLEECLKSCLRQDIDPSNYEIICINDGSTDNSYKILKQYAEKNKNIIVVNQTNSGVSTARNAGISIANGDYIWFVDSDDFIAEYCLQELKNIAINNFDIINFGAYAFDEVFSEEEYRLHHENKLVANKTYWGYACFHLYRRELIFKNKISLIKDIKYGEDEMFYNDMHECANKIIQLDKAYYFYRKNPNSAMNNLLNTNNQIKRLESVIISMVILKNGIESGKYKKDFSKSFLQARYKLVQYGFKRLSVKTVKPYFENMKKEGLFDTEKVSELNLPSKSELIKTYLKEHFKIWKRTYYKRTRSKLKKILPSFIVLFLKKAFHIED